MLVDHPDEIGVVSEPLEQEREISEKPEIFEIGLRAKRRGVGILVIGWFGGLRGVVEFRSLHRQAGA
nr:hypothetical protein CFP56_13883 [Quercus suber]